MRGITHPKVLDSEEARRTARTPAVGEAAEGFVKKGGWLDQSRGTSPGGTRPVAPGPILTWDLGQGRASRLTAQDRLQTGWLNHLSDQT